jgi:predicted metal-dependent hydrolase
MNMYYIVGVILVCIVCAFYLNSDYFNLTCVIAKRDGNTYCVRDSDRVQQSAELLAEATERMKQTVQTLKEKYPEDKRVQRLVDNFNPNRIVETLPTSEFTAYSEGKGVKLAFCLRKHKNEMKLIDINTLTFVALHELSHLMTESIGHKQEFWNNFKFMLKHAADESIYEPIDYAKSPTDYCGLMIDDNPLF